MSKENQTVRSGTPRYDANHNYTGLVQGSEVGYTAKGNAYHHNRKGTVYFNNPDVKKKTPTASKPKGGKMSRSKKHGRKSIRRRKSTHTKRR
jgi:hypothetical protein